MSLKFWKNGRINQESLGVKKSLWGNLRGQPCKEYKKTATNGCIIRFLY